MSTMCLVLRKFHSISNGRAMLSICTLAVSGAIGTFIPENSVGTNENYLSKNSQHQCA